MKKALLLITMLLFIICSVLTFYLTNTLKRVRILSHELSIAKDSLKRNSITDNNDYIFNTIQVNVAPEGAFVTLDEYFNFYISLKAGNIGIDNDSSKKAKIVYKNNINSNVYNEFYDTISVNSIEEKIAIKPRKPGNDSLVGEYLFPFRNKYMSFPFVFYYKVLDKETSRKIKSKINN